MLGDTGSQTGTAGAASQPSGAAGWNTPRVSVRRSRLPAGERVLEGMFETIDADGRLMLRAADGHRHLIAAGDVHFGTAATAAVA